MTSAVVINCVNTLQNNMENLTEQIEEIEALSAIYGDDFLVIDEANRIYEIRVSNEKDSWWSATLQFLLPPQYPAKVPPVFEIYSAWMNEADMFEASDMLYTISREHQGEIVLYHWVEALRTFIDEKFVDSSQNKVDEQRNVGQIIETGERFFFFFFFFHSILCTKYALRKSFWNFWLSFTFMLHVAR